MLATSRWLFSWLIVLGALTLLACDDDPPADGDADADGDGDGDADGDGDSDGDADGDSDGDGDADQCEDDEACDDGLFCTGEEQCDPDDASADEEGCVAADEGPCEASGQLCSEDGDACVDSCPDADGDSHTETSCGGDDCDDDDAQRYPGNVEVCDAGHDEDCNPATLGPDGDGDGFISVDCCNGEACGDDCADGTAEVNPGATEVCNGEDEDCDGERDEGVLSTYYVDGDGDGFGDGTAPTATGCTLPAGYSTLGTDCDDTTSARNPGLAEVCDGLDNDCNALLDGPDEDNDRDGFADACASLPEFLTDCDDETADRYPGAPEQCNGLDEDCDGAPAPGEDDDGDGEAAVGGVCVGGTLAETDCNDHDDQINTRADERCNGVDDDCDGTIDGAAASATCSLPHAASSCVGGTCVVDGCDGSYLHCDDDDSNGCEVDGDLSDLFCGSCEISCALSEYCGGGSCESYLNWATSIGGTGFDVATNVAVDDAGNAYVVGTFASASITVGGVTYANAGCSAGSCTDDVLVLRVGPTGTIDWAVRFGVAGSETATGIAVAGGAVYVTGSFQASMTIGSGPLLVHAGNGDAYVARFDADTGSSDWSLALGSAASENGNGVVADAALGVFVVGTYYGATFTIGTTTLTNAPDGHGILRGTIFVARLAAADGAVLWTRAIGGVDSEWPGQPALTSTGLYVVGEFTGTTLVIDDVTLANASIRGGQNAFVTRLDVVDGASDWASVISGRGYVNGAYAATDTGAVYVAGDFYNGELVVGGESHPEAGALDTYVVSFDQSDGAFNWVVPIGGWSYESSASVAASATGRVYVATNAASSPLTVGDVEVETRGSNDVVVLQLDAATGATIFGRSFGGTDYETPNGITIDSTGDVIFAGQFGSSPFIIGDSTLTSAGNRDMFVASILLE